MNVYTTHILASYASAGMAMNLHINYILAYHCISRNGNAYYSKSLHVISYRCYPLGMAMKIKPCTILNVLAPLSICISLYRARMNMQFIASYWPACLPSFCLLVRLLCNYFYYTIPAGGMCGGFRKSTLSSKTWRRSPKNVAKRKLYLVARILFTKSVASIAQICSETEMLKNVVSIAQNCSEAQIVFAVGQPFRKKRPVDYPTL